MLYHNILQSIGNTPMVELTGLASDPTTKIFAKLEGQNPGGSVKDRIALAMVEAAEKAGDLTRDKLILESTSGNTGIGLALVAAAKGYKAVLTMSAGMSEERKKVLRALGAELIETDTSKGTSGAIEKAEQMFAENSKKYWMPHQHSNPENTLAHYQTTAEEILSDLPDLTHFVAGIGTFGTLSGVGLRLKEHNSKIKIVGIEPELGQSIQGLRNMREPNPPELYARYKDILDQKLTALADTAIEHTGQLTCKFGLLVGISSGAALWGALQVAEANPGAVIVTLFPDRAEKYLSTQIFG